MSNYGDPRNRKVTMAEIAAAASGTKMLANQRKFLTVVSSFVRRFSMLIRSSTSWRGDMGSCGAF